MELNSIGQRLKYRRAELGYTLNDVSKRSGLLPQLISDYENEHKKPGVDNIKLLCKALNITSDYLLNDDDFIKGKRETYGNVLNMYLTAVEYSTKDKLIIDDKTRKVTIEINDPYLVNILCLMKPNLDIGGDVAKVCKNINVNMMSDIEIKK